MPMRTLLLGLIVVFAACKTVEVREDVAQPTVTDQDFQLTTQTLTDCTIKFTGALEATAEPLVIEKAVYEFVVEGAVLKASEKALNVNVAAGEKGEFFLEESFTYVKDAAELKAMDSREGGSLLMALRGHLVASMTVTNADGSSSKKKFDVEFAKSKDVRTPRLPHLKLIEWEGGRFGDTEMQVIFHLGVVNPNPFSISLTGLDFAVSLAGKEVAKGSLGAGEKVGPASTGVFDVTALLNEDSHGKEAEKVIKGLVIPYQLTGLLKTPLYEEPLTKAGTVKLNISK